MIFLGNITLAQVAAASLIVVAWLACAFYAAGRASNNDANYWGWTTLGLLTGPLGAAIAYVYFRNAGESKRIKRYSVDGREDMPRIITCPGCGESVPLSYECCQFCGATLHKRHR